MARRVRKGAKGEGQGSLPLSSREKVDVSGYPACKICGEVRPIGSKFHSAKYGGSVHEHCYKEKEWRR